MRWLLSSHSPPALQLPLPIVPLLSHPNWTKKAFLHVLSGALSFNLLLSPPILAATLLPPPPDTDFSCQQQPLGLDEEEEEEYGGRSGATNEGIVEEAWEIVNDSYLDTGRRPWTPEAWQQKRDDLLSTNIPKRSKAHDLIKRMLASLGDPYTRFLSPPEFSSCMGIFCFCHG